MGRELGRYLEARRLELGLSRRDVADRSELSYPYVSQLETGDREPALKAMRALAPVLEMRVEDLAALVAGGDWSGGAAPVSSPMAASPRASHSAGSRPVNRDKVLLSLERRLREVPPLERISLLNEMITHTVEELSSPDVEEGRGVQGSGGAGDLDAPDERPR